MLTFSEENVNKTKTIGKFGEKIAEKYLLENKYKILEKNYLCKYGEIDIIAKYKKDLVFIEVKTRTNMMYGEGINSIDWIKKKHIYKTAEYYLYGKNTKNINIRIDAIEVFLYDTSVTLKHYQDIILEKP